VVRAERKAKDIRKAFIRGDEAIVVLDGIVENLLILRLAQPEKSDIISRQTRCPYLLVQREGQICINQKLDHWAIT
jgi:hypothetical protein